MVCGTVSDRFNLDDPNNLNLVKTKKGESLSKTFLIIIQFSSFNFLTVLYTGSREIHLKGNINHEPEYAISIACHLN